MFNRADSDYSMFSTFPILFQSVGNRNPLFAYLISNLVNSSMSIILVSMETYKDDMITSYFRMNLTFALTSNDRLILDEYRSSNFVVSKEAYNSRNISQIIFEICE